MSDTVGRITVQAATASQVFPLVTDFPHGRAQKRLVIAHQFGSANAKIEQRFYVGSPATRYTFKSARLIASLRLALRNFWEARQGAAGAFFYDAPNEDQTFTRKTVCFENTPLTFEELSDSICGAGVVFVEIPDPADAPVYSLGATVARFPNNTLTDALLDQVQEIIPLVRIRVLDSDVPDILLSDRRVTIRDSRGGGDPVDYLYLPRLLEVGEPGAGVMITQNIDGSSDDVTFAFGNADRVMVQVANDTQLRWARIELSLYHVGSTMRLDLWAGYITDWQSDASPAFTVRASDILSALTLSSPVGTVARQCWRRLGHDGCAWNPGNDTRDLTHFSSASTSTCDLGYNTPNGCRAHGVQGSFGATFCAPQGVMLRSGSIGLTFPGAIPIIGGLVGTFVGSVEHWYPRTSIIGDTIYGQPLPEIWHHDDGAPQYALPVSCKIAAGRHEDQYYAALGIVGRGPIGAFTTPQMCDSNGDAIKDTFVGSTLDGQPNHGAQFGSDGNLKAGADATLGLRQVLGADPAGAHDYFSLGRVSETGLGWVQYDDGSWMQEIAYAHSAYNEVFAAGIAFCEMRITQVRDAPFTSPGQHTMLAAISRGLTALAWTAPDAPADPIAGCTNPFWVAINTFLRAVGALPLSSDLQENYFDVAAAAACGTIADTSVAKIFGTGNEIQFRFKGSIDSRKPVRDWLQAILNAGCGYYTWSFGKLKVGCRSNASAVSAFTTGNTLFQTVKLTAVHPQFEKLTVQFADQEYGFQSNTVDYLDQDHAARNNRIQNPLGGEFPLSGCSTKSHAGRVATVRAREELGGTTQAEQDAARVATWRSTILALDTEAGMVVSLADADLPGGTGNFRVKEWRLNRDWSIDFTGQSVTASMYDMTTGPKPSDVTPAPIPTEPLRDDGPPPAPAFGVEVNGLASLALEITGIAFDDTKNTHSIRAAKFTVWFTDPTATEYLVGSALGSGDPSVTLASTPSLVAGDYIQIGAELLLCGTPSGAVVPVTRARLGSPAASAIVGATVQKLFPRGLTATFTPGVFDGGDSGDWAIVERIPETKVAAVTGYVTNAYGDSPTANVCTTDNGEHGLPLTAPPPGTTADAVVSVTNENKTLSAGPQIVNVVATSVDCIVTLPAVDSEMQGFDVKVNLSPGSTHVAKVRPHSGDTIQASGDDYVISEPGASVIIEAT
ncbi:MAG: hypothetical protein NTW28_08845 [Candidatus Solibacter sp.]|nr:hypothetical protein [Candidatus Solibacter sp.]